ncbi:DUF1642 domain-containing protein [Streptococcus sp. zg-JUN1979]|uniref:DUF1642 domain-containing protein n=1 Tax=Streptococcus sp. zg-JUN1979 TaxID=3391450 RepID=UPI0039A615D1
MAKELKYKNGEDLIIKAKVIHDSPDNSLDYRLVIGGIYGSHFSEEVLDNLVIETPQKPIIPKFVMDWYETRYSGNDTVEEILDYFVVIPLCDSPVAKWLYDFNRDKSVRSKRQHALATLITYGPEAVDVEKEKKYFIKFKNTGQVLFKTKDGFEFRNYHPDYTDVENVFTREILEQYGFKDVFDNPMFEVEEVE